MSDNETVTISADYFAKLHRLANETINICKECREEHTAEEFNAIKKERDELRAKLVYAEREEEKCKGITTEYRRCRDSLAAAERCINDIEKKCDCEGLTFCKIMDVIRAYREAKEAK